MSATRMREDDGLAGAAEDRPATAEDPRDPHEGHSMMDHMMGWCGMGEGHSMMMRMLLWCGLGLVAVLVVGAAFGVRVWPFFCAAMMIGMMLMMMMPGHGEHRHH